MSGTVGGTDVRDFISGILMGLSVVEILAGIGIVGKKLLKQWNLPENLRGVGAVALGYLEGEEPKAAPRKEGYIVEVR